MKSRKSIIIVITLIWILFAVTFFIYQSNSSKSCEEAYAELKSIVIKGFVVKKFVNYENHALESVVLQTQDEMKDTVELFHFDRNGIFEKLEKGDSLIKSSGSYNLLIFRNGEQIDLMIDYKCR